MDVRTCPECGGESKVKDVRDRVDGTVRRRRKCLECGKEWSTIEINMRDYLTRTIGKGGKRA